MQVSGCAHGTAACWTLAVNEGLGAGSKQAGETMDLCTYRSMGETVQPRECDSSVGCCWQSSLPVNQFYCIMVKQAIKLQHIPPVTETLFHLSSFVRTLSVCLLHEKGVSKETLRRFLCCVIKSSVLSNLLHVCYVWICDAQHSSVLDWFQENRKTLTTAYFFVCFFVFVFCCCW